MRDGAADGGVGVEDDVPGGVVGQADRQRGDQLGIAGLMLLYSLRFALAAPETARGLRRMVLDAALLPAHPEEPVPEAIGPLRTKKAVLLGLYRAHPDYGDRSRASRVAAELAAQAGLQAGTARSYLYAELDGRAS